MTRRGSAAPGRGLRVSVTDARGRAVASPAARGLAAWLRRAAPGRARGVVAIAVVPDTVMRRLNRTHRGVDRATDVLSFPASGRGVLGDIAIARGVSARQAREAGHAVAVEWRVLALHGLLHLLGYDHDTDLGEMARAEERLRRRAGLPAGLIGRAGRRRRSRHS